MYLLLAVIKGINKFGTRFALITVRSGVTCVRWGIVR